MPGGGSSAALLAAHGVAEVTSQSSSGSARSARPARALGSVGGRPLPGRPQALDRLAVRALQKARLVGPRRQHDAGTCRPAARAASTVSSVWLMVPRPGRAATSERQRRALRRGRAQEKSSASGTSRPPTPSHTSDVGARRPRRARRRAAPGRSARRPARRPGAGRPPARSGRARPPRATARRRRAASSSWSCGHSPGRLVEPGDRRLERGHALAAGGQRRADRGGQHGLADAGVGAGDEEAAQRRVLPQAAWAQAVEARARRRRAGGLECFARAIVGARCRAAPPRRACARPRRSSALVCEAITASRSREVPAGHGRRAGWPGRTRPARAPARAAVTAAVGVTDHQRHDLAVSLGAVRQPCSASASRRTRALRCSFSTRRGCSRSSSSAASAAATAGGGQGGGEDQRARRVHQVLARSARRSST